MAKKDPKVLATLLKFSIELDGAKCIKAKFIFDLTKTNLNDLHNMRTFYVGLEEPDRGAKRPTLGEFSGRLLEIKIPKAPGKEGIFMMRFDDSNMAVKALRQIGECEPSTVYLIRTELELPLNDEHHEDDGQQEIDE